MSTTTRQIRVKTGKYMKPDRREEHGVLVAVTVSPYDVPQTVDGSFNHDVNRFVIKFGYIGGDEPTDDREGDDAVTLQVGRNSGRLYEIHVDIKKLGASAVGLIMREVDDAIERLEDTSKNPTRKRNYEIAREVVSDSAYDLLTPAAGQ